MADNMNHAAGNSGVPESWAALRADLVAATRLAFQAKADNPPPPVVVDPAIPGSWVNEYARLQRMALAGNAGPMTAEKARFLAENNRLRDDARRFEAAYKHTMQKFEALKNELADRDAMIADMQCKSINRIQRMADAAAKIEELEAELAALKAKPSTRDNADVASTLLRAVEKYSENEEIANLEKELAERDDRIQTLRWELAALKASQSTPGLVQSTPSVDPGSQIAAFAGRWASRKLDGR